MTVARRRLPGWWPAAAGVATFLIVWEVGVRLGIVAPIFFPPPSRILASIAALARGGELWAHTMATLSRVAIGFALGGGSGFVVGLVMGFSTRAREALDPLVAAIHPIPKLAIFPLFLVIFGIGETATILVIAVASFFPLAINTATGVRRISPAYYDVARACGAGPRKLFWRVVIPAALPMIMSGVRLSFNLALLISIGVELVTAVTGLGSLIWRAWQTFRTEEIYAALVVISVLGAGTNALLNRLSRTLVPWVEEQGT